MAITYTSIPNTVTDQYFGKINKIVWFNVSDTFGTFVVNLYIEPNQTTETTLKIFNKVTKEVMYTQKYSRSSNGTSIIDVAKITHIPGVLSPIYGITVN
jgi:hypothetical protein